MDPLDGVTVFIMVAQCGGFSAAAEKLGCSKSTVSAQVTRLERRIGARLLRRSSRSVSLTDAGRAYLCQIDDVLDRVRRAEKAAQAEAKEPRGLLRVSAPSPFAWTHLAPLLPEFMALHPKITIEMQITAEVVDLITAGFDLAIRLCPTNDLSSVIRRLGGTRLLAVASSDLFARGRTIPATPEELTALPCLANSLHPRQNEWHFRCGTEERVVRVEPRLVVNSLEVLHQLVRAGAGWRCSANTRSSRIYSPDVCSGFCLLGRLSIYPCWPSTPIIGKYPSRCVASWNSSRGGSRRACSCRYRIPITCRLRAWPRCRAISPRRRFSIRCCPARSTC